MNWETVLLNALPPLGRVSGKYGQCGNLQRETLARPTCGRWSGLFQALCACLRPHHRLPRLLPTPITYHWVQSRLWGLVHLQVLCSPASLRDRLFQLDQAYLEVLEALGKRTSPVSDTESPWKWECLKDEGSNRSLRGSILLEVLPHSSSSLP